jgi:hypothetical protein
LSDTRFVYCTTTGAQIECHAINLDGSGRTQLTSGSGDKQAVALAGDRLVYESYAAGNPQASHNLHGIRLDGSGAVDYATTSADERYFGQAVDRLLFTNASAGTVEL